MESPITGKEMKLLKEKRAMIFRKEEFEVVYHYYYCDDSKCNFTTTELDELNTNQLYNKYREKYNFPFPADIKRVREQFGLSGAKMSEILGLGTNCYRNYEAGEIPSISNARLIQLAFDAHEFEKLVKICTSIKKTDQESILKKIDKVLDHNRTQKETRYVKKYMIGEENPCELNGYKTPSMEKFSEMVVFFAWKTKPYKTKMNKLLFYADFLNYCNTGYSISGSKYAAIPNGPVPNNYNSLFEYLDNNEIIKIQHKTFDDGNTGEQFIAKKQFDETVFESAELKILEQIVSTLGGKKTQEVIDLSHKEKAWIENIKNKALIKYGYGFYLSCAQN